MGSVRKEIKGNVYGNRVALGEYTYRYTPSGRRILMEKCRCVCGVERYVQRSHLLGGNSVHCGCIRDMVAREKARKINFKHGMEGTTPYKKFMSAKARCSYPKNPSYYRYGGRGIKMMWKDFAEFREDMGESYYEHIKQYGKDNTTLDRIDVNGDYCKENCRWATWQEQYENMSINHSVVYRGKWYPTIAKMCRELGVKYQLVRDRIWWGRSVEDAVEKPLSNLSHINDKNRRPIQ